MKALAEIMALHLEIDGFLETQQESAITAADAARQAAIEDKQRLNDEAYFILGWGQLELAINDACRNAIRKRRASANPANRRAWELFNPEDRRLSGLRFEDRLSLVLDKDAGFECAWKRVMKYYNTRNQIAHGTLKASHLDLTDVFKDFYVVQGELES